MYILHMYILIYIARMLQLHQMITDLPYPLPQDVIVEALYLRLSSLKTIFEGFLSACWSQREAGRSQRQAEARAACILEGQDDQLIDELRRLDSYIKEGRVEVEKWKDFALQSARNMSS
jgi:hypothetical protein